MKRTFIKLCGFLAIVAIGMSSCKKDGIATDTVEPESNGEVMSFRLDVTNVPVQSRATGAATAPNTSAQFLGRGYILFSEKGKILKRVQIITTGTPDNISSVSLTDLQAGNVRINNVPAKSDSVHIIGNIPAQTNTTYNAIGNATTTQNVRLAQFDITEQPGNLIGVTVEGAGKLISAGVGMSSATVSVAPIIARIEIKNITYDNSNIGATTGSNATDDFKQNISGYDVTGIFINNFNRYMGIGFVPVPGSNTGDMGASASATGGFDTGASFVYSSNGPLSDIGSALGGTNTTLTKSASGVWGYNFFPAKGGLTPHIVLRLQNIQGNSIFSSNTYQWVTVQKFTFASGTTFERNKYYTISSITFNNNHIANAPETSYNNSSVVVSVAPTTEIVTTPEMNPGT